MSYHSWLHISIALHVLILFLYGQLANISTEPGAGIGNELNTRCTNVVSEVPRKKRKIIKITDNSDDEQSFLSSASTDTGGFRPLHLIATWLEPKTMARLVSLVLLLPSGICSGDFAVRVSGDGEYFEFTVVWPEALVDFETLYKKWLLSDGSDKMQPYHPKLLAFESALKDLRAKANEAVTSITSIKLPFKVETHIHEKYNLAWRTSTSRMVYVDLREAMGTYGLLNDDEEFEEV